MIEKYWLLLVCTGLTAKVLASDTQSAIELTVSDQITEQSHFRHIISQAITAFEQTARKDWSYRISRYENEEGDISRSIERYDPAKIRSQQWDLLRIDGQEPTPKQEKTFIKNQLKESDDKEQQSFSIKLRDIIQIESLEVISESPDKIQAGFKVMLSQLGKKASQNLIGSLSFDKNHQFIDAIEITNTDSFSPMFSAVISELKLTLRFIKIDDAILPEQHDLLMKGTFAFFTKIDEVSTDIYSDYHYVVQ